MREQSGGSPRRAAGPALPDTTDDVAATEVATTLRDSATASGLDRVTIAQLVAALALTMVHHADHALRVDHSGWPFRPRVTPFTFGLLAYPMILFALLGARRLYWLRWAGLPAGAAFVVFAHSAIERPQIRFVM